MRDVGPLNNATIQPDVLVALSNVARTLLLPALDALCILIIPLAQSRASPMLENPNRFRMFWTLLALVTILLIYSYGGYQSWEENRFKTAKLAVRCFIATAVLMLTVAVVLGHQHAITPLWTDFEIVSPALLLVFTRVFAAESVVATPQSAGPVVICFNRCPDDLGTALAARRIASRPSGVWFFADQAAEAPISDWPRITSREALWELLRTRNVKDVVLAYHAELESLSAEARKALLSDLLALPIRIWLAFSLAPQLPLPFAKGVGRCRLVPVASDRLINSRNVSKRAFDIVVGVILLAAAMPLLGVIALLVRGSSPGPIVFRQKRVGAHNLRFTVLKFRTMTHVAGQKFEQAAPRDARVTRIGRFLRRTSLDEMLQLVNVIRGEMSLVGPRPHAPETQVQGIDFEQAVQFYRLRHRVKPGMTGLAQIRGHRGGTTKLETLENRIACDLEYIDTWSIWLDILIILRTLPTLITQRNAY